MSEHPAYTPQGPWHTLLFTVLQSIENSDRRFIPGFFTTTPIAETRRQFYFRKQVTETRPRLNHYSIYIACLSLSDAGR